MSSNTIILECQYTSYSHFDLKDLGVKLDRVKEYWVKWDKLNIIYKDGTTETFEPNYHGEDDCKSPTSIVFLDDNYNELDAEDIIG